MVTGHWVQIPSNSIIRGQPGGSKFVMAISIMWLCYISESKSDITHITYCHKFVNKTYKRRSAHVWTVWSSHESDKRPTAGPALSSESSESSRVLTASHRR